MKAIAINRVGGPEVLEHLELAAPVPGASDLLVKTSWAGVNYIDIYQRSGSYPQIYPTTLGLEGSGQIIAVGSAVTGFSVGDWVCWAWAQGSYAELTVVNQEKAFLIPKGVTSKVAAAAMMQALTAHYLMTSVYPAKAGDTALVHAAAGGVGLVLCQMLRSRGVRVLGTVSSAEKESLALAAGAADVIRYDREDFQERVLTLTDNKKCHVVYDGVGATTFEGSVNCLAPRGTLALFGASSGPVPPFDLQRLGTLGSLVITRPSLAHFIQNRDELAWRCNEIFTDITSGSLNISIAREYSLEDAEQAHRDLESRMTSGKLLLAIGSD
jgi:NADPH2:quinone reductase